MNFHLRDYLPADFPTLCAIDAACYEPEIVYSPREMRAYLRGPGAECILAETTDEAAPRIAGFCITTHKRGEGYIVTIDVLEEFRRLGAGNDLLGEAERRLAARGVHTVHLDTATDNVAAIAFWQKHGYRTQGIRRGYYPNGHDAFAMLKSIAPVVAP